MSKKQSGASGKGGGLPADLPKDFFDSNKKGKKAQEDDLAKELEQFEREMAALQAESDEQLKEEFEKLQDDKNLDELDQQIDQWKRIIELEKKAEELKNRPISENPTKKFKQDTAPTRPKPSQSNESDQDLDSIEDFEDKLFDWRSKGLR